MLAATVLHFSSFNLAKCDLCPSLPDQQQTLVLVSRSLANRWTEPPRPESAAAAAARPRSHVTESRSVDAVSPVPVEKVEARRNRQQSSPPTLAISVLTAEGTAAASESLFLTTQ